MNNDKTIQAARALIDGFNQRDLNIWERVLANDFEADYPGSHGLGKEAAKMYNLAFLNASDDIHFDVLHTYVDGDRVVLQCGVSATLDHDLVTPMGTFPATHKPDVKVPVPFVLIAEVNDGKIVSEETVWNQLEVFGTIWGILPVPA